MTRHADNHQTRRELVAFLLAWVAICALVLLLATGCVSQGEFDAVLTQLETTKGQLATVRKRNAEMVRDAQESAALWQAVLDWLDEDDARLRKILLGGTR